MKPVSSAKAGSQTLTQFVSTHQTTRPGQVKGLMEDGVLLWGGRRRTQVQSIEIREPGSWPVTKAFVVITQVATNTLENILEGGKSPSSNFTRCFLIPGEQNSQHIHVSTCKEIHVHLGSLMTLLVVVAVSSLSLKQGFSNSLASRTVYAIWRRGRWEGGSGWGIPVKPWLILVNVWQKPLQYCKVINKNNPTNKNKIKSAIHSKNKNKNIEENKELLFLALIYRHHYRKEDFKIF